MIVRIVKMEFEEVHITDFESLFKITKDKIATSKGCRELCLLHDIHKPQIFMTYSIWDSEEDLLAYRNSELFNSTWNIAKEWFSAKPEAWSHHKIN